MREGGARFSPPSSVHVGGPGVMPGRIALVTGASSGIGRAVSRVLAQRGYNLVLVARRRERLLRLRSEICDTQNVRVCVADEDLCRPGAAEDLVGHVGSSEGAIDILVNSAGFGMVGEFARTDWDRERDIIELNVAVLTHLTKLVVQGMIERKQGRILNVASTAAFRPGPLNAVYAATKAYVLSFSEALSCELAHSGVSVTALCPGPTDTEFASVASLGSREWQALWKAASAMEVAEFGVDAMMRGCKIAIPGFANRTFAALARAMPRSVVSWLAMRASRLHEKRACSLKD
jgi:uncharacterized protein